MITARVHTSRRSGRLRIHRPACLLLLLALVGGCSSHSHTFDPKLRKIDEMLDAHLPKGNTRDRVGFFLTTRGYKVEGSPNVHTVIATVRHIDTETLQPATARVVF